VASWSRYSESATLSKSWSGGREKGGESSSHVSTSNVQHLLTILVSEFQASQGSSSCTISFLHQSGWAVSHFNAINLTLSSVGLRDECWWKHQILSSSYSVESLCLVVMILNFYSTNVTELNANISSGLKRRTTSTNEIQVNENDSSWAPQ